MNAQIAAILAIDGITTGAVYALVAIGTVLIFTVTRVIYVPFGDIAAFTALTLAALDAKQLPGTIWLVVVLAVLASAIEVASLLRAGRAALVPRALLFYLVAAALPVGIVWVLAPLDSACRFALFWHCCSILPIAPLLDRIVFRPIADASVLLLLTVSVALALRARWIRLAVLRPGGRADGAADARSRSPA